MQDFERAIETRKNEMLSEYPQQQALTILVMDLLLVPSQKILNPGLSLYRAIKIKN